MPIPAGLSVHACIASGETRLQPKREAEITDDSPRLAASRVASRRGSTVARHALALTSAAVLGACGATGRLEPSAQRAADAPSERVWDYRVRAGVGARELRVEAELPHGVPQTLGVDAFAHPFLSELELATEHGWQPVAATGRRWIIPRCQERGCRLRYRYHLGQAAEIIDRFAFAGYRAGVLMAPPSTFLLAPQDYSGSDLYRFRVELTAGDSFVSGVWPEPGSKREAALARSTRSDQETSLRTTTASVDLTPSQQDPAVAAGERSYLAPARVLFQAPYSAFGRFERETLQSGDSVLELALAPGQAPLGVSRAGLRSAISAAAAAVTSYYGRFPVPEVTLIVLPSSGSDVFGMQLGNGGATVLLFVGADVRDHDLSRHWVITHELLHLGFPTLPRRYLWMAEGLATYQEPIARARAGLIDEHELWRSLLRGLPKGLPNDSDGGLDGSPRWGRTYWGGALFCLLVDIELRARTHNRLSLDSAARAILLGGGDTSVRWTVEQTLATADAALDRPSLTALYAEHAALPVRVDLDALFNRLGVRLVGERVLFDEGAELAHVRRAIAAPNPARVF
jgi:hypothetical protein